MAALERIAPRDRTCGLAVSSDDDQTRSMRLRGLWNRSERVAPLAFAFKFSQAELRQTTSAAATKAPVEFGPDVSRKTRRGRVVKLIYGGQKREPHCTEKELKPKTFGCLNLDMFCLDTCPAFSVMLMKRCGSLVESLMACHHLSWDSLRIKPEHFWWKRKRKRPFIRLCHAAGKSIGHSGTWKLNKSCTYVTFAYSLI